MSIISESEDITTMAINHYERILRELAEARELLASEKITRNHIIKRSVEVEKERDDAREDAKHWEELCKKLSPY